LARTYWSQFSSARVNRRRLLAGAGGTTLGAAFLAACGGGSGSSGGDGKTQDTVSLIVAPKDTFKAAKRGGTLKEHVTADPPTLDNINPQASLNQIAKFV
jgi:hypothetical protein